MNKWLIAHILIRQTKACSHVNFQKKHYHLSKMLWKWLSKNGERNHYLNWKQKSGCPTHVRRYAYLNNRKKLNLCSCLLNSVRNVKCLSNIWSDSLVSTPDYPLEARFKKNIWVTPSDFLHAIYYISACVLVIYNNIRYLKILSYLRYSLLSFFLESLMFFKAYLVTHKYIDLFESCSQFLPHKC